MSRDKRRENGAMDKEERGRGSYQQPFLQGSRDLVLEEVGFDYPHVFESQPAPLEREVRSPGQIQVHH